MSAHVSKSSASMIRLDKKAFAEDVSNLAIAKAEKKAADAAARAADSVIKGLTGKLLAQMGAAVSALCGEAVLTLKKGSTAPAALTLADGRKVLWTDVRGVMVGNTLIEREEIKTLFGGRETSDSLDVTGTP